MVNANLAVVAPAGRLGTNSDIWSNVMSAAKSGGLARFLGILGGNETLMFGKFASISGDIDSNCRHLGSTGIYTALNNQSLWAMLSVTSETPYPTLAVS